MKRLLVIAATLLAFLSPAIAADSTVPAMGAASAVSGTDGFYCIQGSGTTEHECTASQFATYIQSTTFTVVNPGQSIQTALTAVASTGGTVYVKAGTYAQTTTLLISSNTRLQCEQGATITATNVGWTGASNWLLANINFAAGSITDHDIVVEGCGFSALGTFATDGTFHHIHFVEAQHILIDEKNSFAGGGDGTAMLATNDTVVANNYMTGALNACWDHFLAPTSAVVHANYCETALYGILITGTNSAHSTAGVAQGGAITDNTVSLTSTSTTQAGIWLNGLGASGSGTSNIAVSNNYVIGNGTGNFVCLRATGAGVDDVFSANICRNSGTASIGFQSGSDAGGSPSNVSVIGNIFDNIQVQSSDVAVVKLNGTGTAAYSNQVRGGSYPFAFALAGTNNIAWWNTATAGSSGTYTTSGSTNPSVVDSSNIPLSGLTGTGSGVNAALAIAPGTTGSFSTQDGAITTGNCLKWGPGLQDAGAICGSGSSTITAGTTPTSGITSGNFISSTTNLVADSGKSVPTGAVVGTTDTQTLTNKTLTSPTLTTPALGTPASGTLTNTTGFPTANLSGAGTGVLAALGNATNGVGGLVGFSGALGTPTSGTATNLTGLPLAGLTGLGTGVATALGNTAGGTGGFVVVGGALGTPSTGIAVNLTGLPISGGVSGLGTGVATLLGGASSGTGGPAGTASPTFTGTPTAPTATVGTSTTQLATTAFVLANTAIYQPYIVGNWYIPFAPGAVTGGNAPGSGTIILTPGFIQQTTTLNTLGLVITTTSASGNVQAAIYANNPATGRPTGTALASTASMSTTSAANVNSAVSVQLQPGIYWFAVNNDNGTSAVRSYSITSTFPMASLIGSATQANSLNGTNSVSAVSVTQTFGTWPDLTSATFAEITGSNKAPIVQFKIGSVP